MLSLDVMGSEKVMLNITLSRLREVEISIKLKILDDIFSFLKLGDT